jgi:hypothetical protein
VLNCVGVTNEGEGGDFVHHVERKLRRGKERSKQPWLVKDEWMRRAFVKRNEGCGL